MNFFAPASINFSQLSWSSVLTLITTQHMWWLGMILFGITTLISIIIVWHWYAYGIGVLRKTGFILIYTTGTFLLLSLFFITLMNIVKLL